MVTKSTNYLMEYGFVGPDPGPKGFTWHRRVAPTFSTAYQHIGLVYSFINSRNASLTLYINGCKVDKVISNESVAALKAVDGIGFGNEFHPQGLNRGWHGKLDAIAVTQFQGDVNPKKIFQILSKDLSKCN